MPSPKSHKINNEGGSLIWALFSGVGILKHLIVSNLICSKGKDTREPRAKSRDGQTSSQLLHKSAGGAKGKADNTLRYRTVCQFVCSLIVLVTQKWSAHCCTEAGYWHVHAPPCWRDYCCWLISNNKYWLCGRNTRKDWRSKRSALIHLCVLTSLLFRWWLLILVDGQPQGVGVHLPCSTRFMARCYYLALTTLIWFLCLRNIASVGDWGWLVNITWKR